LIIPVAARISSRSDAVVVVEGELAVVSISVFLKSESFFGLAVLTSVFNMLSWPSIFICLAASFNCLIDDLTRNSGQCRNISRSLGSPKAISFVRMSEN
jgi:hypothetical protein